MPPSAGLGRRAVLTAVFVVLTGCSGKIEPAQRSISNIEAALAAVAPPATQYAPDELHDVRGSLERLRVAFNDGDYERVLADAPAVLNAARGLGEVAATRRADLSKALERQWSELAAVLPDRLDAVENRLDKLDNGAARKATPRVDLEAARMRLSRLVSMWSKAQAAFATGNLTEAVSSARAVDGSLAELAVSLDGRVAAH